LVFSYDNVTYNSQCAFDMSFKILLENGMDISSNPALSQSLSFNSTNQTFWFYTNDVSLVGKQRFRLKTTVDDRLLTSEEYQFDIDIKVIPLIQSLPSTAMANILSSN